MSETIERGNVLVIGNSGVGKSTLINAVLGEDRAMQGWGTHGTTAKLEIYESEKIPFRIIDTIGFEPSPLKKYMAIKAVQDWSKESAKDGKEDTGIDLIWFCVDGTSSKLFPDAIESMAKATRVFKTVPIIVVITKSFSIPDRAQNMMMVKSAFASQKKIYPRLKAVVPVVAQTFHLNDVAYAAPDGITELIDATNRLMPEGIKAGDKDIASFKLDRRRVFAQSVTFAATVAAAAVGAIPVPVADAAVLSPVEIAEVNTLARIYGIHDDDESKRLIQSIVEAGTVGVAAKTTISTIKAIPGINLAASVINAIVAGSIVFILGEGSIYAFEKIYLGEKSASDTDWARDVIEGLMSGDFTTKIQSILTGSGDDVDGHQIAEVIAETFSGDVSSVEVRQGKEEGAAD